MPDNDIERQLLLGHLNGARRHIQAQLEGLTDEQLRMPVLPSGWTCLGLVRHLTLGDERYWFETVMGGAPLDYWPEGEGPDDGLAEWRVAADESSEQVIADYRAAIERADAIIEGLSLDDPPKSPEAWWEQAGMNFSDLRHVLMHVISETATHSGHLDAARELIDGKQYLVL